MKNTFNWFRMVTDIMLIVLALSLFHAKAKIEQYEKQCPAISDRT